MISLFTGPVGSGKSYHALRSGLDKVYTRGTRYVIANFPIVLTKNQKSKAYKKELERWKFIEEITPEFLIAFSLEKGFIGREGICLLIIDEAGVMFNSRDWQVKAQERSKWIKFFSQSRKFGYDVILIAQSDRMIDKQIRSLAEYHVRHNNIRAYWWLRWIPMRLHVAIWSWYHTKIQGTLEPFIINLKIAKKYDTMKIFNTEDISQSIRKIYEGKIVPAPVLTFISNINQLENEKNSEKTSKKKHEAGGGPRSGGAPA